MNRIPIRLAVCPIEEAVYEVRFQSKFPSDAVFGIFYQVLNRTFVGATLTPMPILQLPEAVRQSDPNLQYQAHHRLQKGNLSISVGPRVIIFSNQKPYVGWNTWRAFIAESLNGLVSLQVFEGIERTGLRYINVFDGSLLNKTNVSLNVIDTTISDQSTTLRSEFNDGEYIKILQIANSVSITAGEKSFIGSATDIDILSNAKHTNDEFGNIFIQKLDASHDKVKELFFNLLKQDFIDTLNPIYEEL